VTAYDTNDPTRLEFTWDSIDDPGSYTVRYRAWLVNQLGQVKGTLRDGRWLERASTPPFTNLNLSTGETYYVHVMVWDGLGNTSEGVSNGVILDNVPPVVSITTPPGGELHLAPGVNSFTLSGTATDADSGVAVVEVKIGAAEWDEADYNPSTHVWTYTWNNIPAGPTIIGARAIDVAGNVASVYRQVRVTFLSLGVAYVKPHELGTHDGTSWATAWDTVQEGLDDADRPGAQAEVWVAEGEYINQDYESLELRAGVALYGGFAGTEVAREQRDWVVHPTILDGGGTASVVTASWLLLPTRIDGFVIQNGSSDGDGGGIYSDHSDLWIENNTISGNTAQSSGGGIYCDGAARICGNAIVGNTAGADGGGIGAFPLYEADVVISGNTITHNTAAGSGGGIHGLSTIQHNTISNNTAQGNGGGIWTGGQLRYNLISDNTAELSGGGVYAEGGTISNNLITGNIAFDKGGGIRSQGNIRMTNNAIVGNTADLGAGIYCFTNAYECAIVNNTVAYNTIDGDPTGKCGGIHFYTSQGLLANCIVADNDGAGIKRDGQLSPTLRYNCVYGHGVRNYEGIDQGTQDINTDPKLAEDHHHIDQEADPPSPCIDTGNDDDASEEWVDIDGEERIKGDHVDRGADETGEGGGPVQHGYTLQLMADPYAVCIGGASTVTAYVRKGYDIIGGQTVTFSIVEAPQSATASLDPSSDTTDPGAQTEVTCDTGGWVTVRGTATVDGYVVQGAVSVRFYDCVNLDQGAWPMFMHDPQHTGMSSVADDTLTETLTESWSADVSTAQTSQFYYPMFDSSPVVYAGVVIVGVWNSESSGAVRAYAGTNGTLLWTTEDRIPMGGVASTPAIRDGRVYVGSADGQLYCLDFGNGSLLWNAPAYQGQTPSPVYGSPAVDSAGDTVYIGNSASQVYAFQTDDGDPKDGNWPVQLGSVSERTSSPAITSDGSYLLIGCSDSCVYRISLGGTPTASGLSAYGGAVESSPSIVGGYAYVGCTRVSSPNVFRLSLQPYSIVTSRGLGAEVRTTPACAYGYLYTGNDTGRTFFQMLQSSLSISAQFDAIGSPTYFVGSAALTNTGSAAGLAYVGNDDGRLYVRRGADVSPPGVATATPTGGFIRSSPAIAYIPDQNGDLDRWVFVTSRGDGGRLYAFKTDR
jgi:parallel beta-helix repeat protein/predicted outer membrane repeat protein